MVEMKERCDECGSIMDAVKLDKKGIVICFWRCPKCDVPEYWRDKNG